MRLLRILLIAAVLAWTGAWWQTRTLPERGAILPELLQEPAQGATTEPLFDFEYHGVTYDVQPVASYELHGLVVTHNDTTGLGDLTHDENSVDTKDLCVIWGPNLESDDYRSITFESTPTWCHWSWSSADIQFDGHAIANNHLVTDDEALRKALDRVHVGDQIRLRGALVNYRDQRYPDFWRNSSTKRTDEGGGACEVVYFEELRVLKPHAPVAWRVRTAMPWVVGALLLALLGKVATSDRIAGAVRA
jgi:hypothetical protein